MTDERQKKKDEVVRRLADVESESERVEALGQDLARSARLTRDVVGPIRDVLANASAETFPEEALNRQAEALGAWQLAAGEVLQAKTAVNSFTAHSLAVTTTSTGLIEAIYLPPFSPTLPLADVEAATSQLHKTLERFPLAERAQSSMRRLGLDRRSGSDRTPLELLADAKGALELPALRHGGPASALLPLRECIDAAIAALLQRRPSQERTRNVREKLISLGRQCRRDGLDEAYFDRLASEADSLRNDLSGAKKADMPRERAIQLFHRGLLVLNSLMEGIDENRLRPA